MHASRLHHPPAADASRLLSSAWRWSWSAVLTLGLVLLMLFAVHPQRRSAARQDINAGGDAKRWIRLEQQAASAVTADGTGERSTAMAVSAGKSERQLQPLVHLRRLDTGFRLLREVRPHYPAEARWRKISGWARLELLVNNEGQVVRIALLEKSGSVGFGRSALEAWGKARFTPPTMEGRAVRVRWRQMVYFRP